MSTYPSTTRLAVILSDLCCDPLPFGKGCDEREAYWAGEASEARGDRNALVSPTATARRDISIGEILDRTRHAGFGFIAALLALASVPLVGLTVPFGLAVAAIGGQMMAGMSRPWLPQFICRRRITLATLESLSHRTARWTAKLSHAVRPRLTWLTAGPFRILCGLGLLIQGLSLTLPVPGADWLFVIPIVLYGVALLECDGLLILVCHVITLVQIVLGTLLWELIALGFVNAYDWGASVLK